MFGLSAVALLIAAAAEVAGGRGAAVSQRRFRVCAAMQTELLQASS